MSDKYLSVVEWKKFAKGHDLKDTALIKAFEALDKAERAAPELRLKALAPRTRPRPPPNQASPRPSSSPPP
ncbi:MAG TPA: hypothetical protein H9903_09445 [Candidatus Aquabacterium excrementipullorum]|nr:hypothetical protein [Candidatus Aquabacterium excrementipullorum]